jgi:hypothetical protein
MGNESVGQSTSTWKALIAVGFRLVVVGAAHEVAALVAEQLALELGQPDGAARAIQAGIFFALRGGRGDGLKTFGLHFVLL